LSAGSGPVDLNELARDVGYRIEVRATERPEELESRLRREELELQHRLEKERSDAEHHRRVEMDETMYRRRVFGFVAGIIVVAGAVSFVLAIVDSGASAETQARLRTVASGVVAGLVGYVVGSVSKLK
jgi:hypothetical protein